MGSAGITQIMFEKSLGGHWAVLHGPREAADWGTQSRLSEGCGGVTHLWERKGGLGGDRHQASLGLG